MHIEINAGGLGGGIAIAEYGSNMSNFINNTESVISSFKTVRDSTYGLNGGVGNLQSAVSNISSRVQAEIQKKNDAISIRNKTNDFLDLAVRVDKEVEVIVNKNKDEFYRVNPWLKPSVVQDEEKPWYEQAWEWLCGVAEAVSEAANQAWNWISDTASKLWESAVEFYQEHKKAIATLLMVAVAITALVLVSIIPGGGLLAAIVVGAAWGTIFGAAAGGVIGGLQSMSQGGSFWEGAEEGAFSGAINGAVSGAIFGGIGFAGQAFGETVSCMSTLGKSIKTAHKISSVASFGMDGLDVLATADSAINPSSNIIADFNAQLHSSALYNFAQTGANVVSTFTGGALQTMTCFVAGTLVLTAKGLRAIEEIKAGDYVISTNPDTMETTQKEVLETFVLKNNRLIHLCINGENITTTENHPFFVAERGFVKAGELCVGDHIRKLNGDIAIIESCNTEELSEPATVYNFQVADYHTYYVGNICVLVHNADCVVEFNNNSGLDRDEFTDQLSDQEKGLNQMTVDDYLKNRENYINNGRSPEGTALQQQARKEALATRIESNIENGMGYDQAVIEAESWIDTQAALHGPDQIAGGDPSNIIGMGDKRINSSIGSQWRSRVKQLDDYVNNLAKNMSPTEMKNTYLDVKLILK